MKTKKDTKVPKKMQAYYDTVVELTDSVCIKYLSSEYATLAREMAAALSRKRPSPLLRGQPTTWACGIAYVLGRVNFLFDKSQNPHMPATTLCELFGVSPSAASAKAKQIEQSLGVRVMDPRWCLPSILEQNPMAWMIEVDGWPVDARMAPIEIQEEAFRRELIPYVFAEGQTTEEE